MSRQPFTVTRALFVIAVIACLALLPDAGLANSAADLGTVSGTVLGADGKPAVSLALKLVQDMPIKMGRPGSGKGKSAGLDSGAGGLQSGGRKRTKVIAQVTTDAQGKFSFPNVEAGGYRIEAGSNRIGWIYMDVTVEANKTTDLGEIKLTKLD